jgi:hypothetical protein
MVYILQGLAKGPNPSNRKGPQVVTKGSMLTNLETRESVRSC